MTSLIDPASNAGGNAALGHPWLAKLKAQPEREVRRLFAGVADIAPYHGADISDAVMILFEGVEADAAEVSALEQGLLYWLETHRVKEWNDHRDHWVLVRHVIDAFDIVARVDLPGLAQRLWHQYALWYNWADQHILAPHADVRIAYLRTLALTQDRIDPADYERRMAFWLDICGRAGRSYPDYYVDVGLLGLQALPLPLQAEGYLSNESLCIIGLLNWVTDRSQMWSAFAQRWLDLKHAFPHRESYWQDLFKAIVYPRRHELSEEFLTAWAENVGIKIRSSRLPKEAGYLPFREDARALIGTMPALKAKEAIQKSKDLVARAEVHAREYGITEFVVKSACNLGQALLRTAKGPIAMRAEAALDFAMAALRWEPQDTHGWSLWRDSLIALQRFADAEVVAWESIRRFPNAPVLAVNLSQLWIAEGHLAWARALLEETISKTDDIYSLTLLAGLLLKSHGANHRPQAELLLRKGVQRNDLYSRNMLAGLLMRSHSVSDRNEAEDLMRDTLRRTGSPHARIMLAGLLFRRAHAKDLLEVEGLLRGAYEDDSSAQTMLAWFLWGRDNEGDRDEAKALLYRNASKDRLARRLLFELMPKEVDDQAENAMRRELSSSGGLEGDENLSEITIEFHDHVGEEPATASPSEERPAAASGKDATQPDLGGAHHETTGKILDQAFHALVTDAARPRKGSPPPPLRKEQIDIPIEDVGAPEATGAAGLNGELTWSEGKERSDTHVMNSIRSYGAAARSAFLMQHGNTGQKAEARKSLLALSEEDDLPFARFLLLGVQPARQPTRRDLESGSFGLALLSALRARSVERVAELEATNSQEGLLCALVKAAIVGELVDGREVVGAFLRRARLEGILLGPASVVFIQLANATRSQIVVSNDNELILKAALGSAFQMPIAA